MKVRKVQESTGDKVNFGDIVRVSSAGSSDFYFIMKCQEGQNNLGKAEIRNLNGCSYYTTQPLNQVLSYLSNRGSIKVFSQDKYELELVKKGE